MLQHHKSYAPMYGRVQESNSKSWQPSGSTHQGLPPQQNLPYLVDQENPPQPHASFGSQGYPWNYQQYYDQNKENFGGYNYPLHEQNNLPVYERKKAKKNLVDFIKVFFLKITDFLQIWEISLNIYYLFI